MKTSALRCSRWSSARHPEPDRHRAQMCLTSPEARGPRPIYGLGNDEPRPAPSPGKLVGVLCSLHKSSGDAAKLEISCNVFRVNGNEYQDGQLRPRFGEKTRTRTRVHDPNLRMIGTIGKIWQICPSCVTGLSRCNSLARDHGRHFSIGRSVPGGSERDRKWPGCPSVSRRRIVWNTTMIGGCLSLLATGLASAQTASAPTTLDSSTAHVLRPCRLRGRHNWKYSSAISREW